MLDLDKPNDSEISMCSLLPVEVLEMVVERVRKPRDRLKLRQVNKILKDVSESILQKVSWSSFWSPSCSVSNFDDLLNKMGNTFTTAEQVDNFMTAMKHHSGNPFPTGHVTISREWDFTFVDYNDEDTRQFDFQSIPKLLSTFGSHITSITYFGGVGGRHMRGICRIIFANLLNLRCLRLLALETILTVDSSVFPPQQALEHFSCLSILGSQDVLLADAILSRYANQIESLECNGWMLPKVTYFTGESLSGSCLTELKVENVNDLTITKLIECSQKKQWHIKRLSLVLSFRKHPKLSNLLQLISQFSATLEELCVDMCSRDIRTGNSFQRVASGIHKNAFPVLKKLSMTFCLFMKPGGMEIVKMFKALERLEIINYHLQGFCNIYRQPSVSITAMPSIAWKFCPLLQKIVIFDIATPKRLLRKLYRPTTR